MGFGTVSLGEAGQARLGVARQGTAWLVTVRHGGCGRGRESTPGCSKARILRSPGLLYFFRDLAAFSNAAALITRIVTPVSSIPSGLVCSSSA